MWDYTTADDRTRSLGIIIYTLCPFSLPSFTLKRTEPDRHEGSICISHTEVNMGATAFVVNKLDYLVQRTGGIWPWAVRIA